MKNALRHIESTTIDFLAKKLCKIVDYREANELLTCLSGIDTFFRKEEDFLTLLEILHSDFKTHEKPDRREYGDFQTPPVLTDYVCSYLAGEFISPNIVVEPTFGKGNFLLSALKYFPKLKRIYGVEIYEPYYWRAKFTILEMFIKNSVLNKPRIFLYLSDIFKFDFTEISKAVEDDNNVLILGNPPWVTNSELGSLNSSNLPKKSNFKSLNGLEAITGKGNFDTGEYIILTTLDSFSKYDGCMAMLAKNSVIRNLIHDLPKTNYRISNAVALKINAKEYFDASVEASLFKCHFKSNKHSFTCKTASIISPNSVENEFGWVGDKFVSNVALYTNNKKYDGISPYIWRQGVKHDCSQLMELDFVNGKYMNGFKSESDLEKEPVYGLVKSSDLNLPVVTKPKKHVIITQKRVGEDTACLSYKFPNLYKYLTENMHVFEQRKSSIYKDKPPFSIFGIGDYSFKPFKVAISGLYKRSTFSLILPENDKPLMLDDTCYFIGFDDISESVIVWAILNSEPVQQLIAALTFLDAKRPYTKELLMRIDINKAAEDMSYEEIVSQIRYLDEKLLVNVTKDNWYPFEKINKGNLAKRQFSLF